MGNSGGEAVVSKSNCEALNNLLSAWREVKLQHAPYALASDLEVLQSRKKVLCATFKSWGAYIASGLESEGGRLLHLGLIPQPWFGDLQSATVFILLLNPGLNPGDYFAEYEVPSFKEAITANLRSLPDRAYPHIFLDPEFSWHPGGRYFRARLNWLALALRDYQSISYHDALKIVATRVCCLQLVPYHSRAFVVPKGIVNRLESVRLVKTFVSQHLAPRTDILKIVMRQSTEWALPQNRSDVVEYTVSEARAAYLSPSSRGGRALMSHFGLPANIGLDHRH